MAIDVRLAKRAFSHSVGIFRLLGVKGQPSLGYEVQGGESGLGGASRQQSNESVAPWDLHGQIWCSGAAARIGMQPVLLPDTPLCSA